MLEYIYSLKNIPSFGVRGRVGKEGEREGRNTGKEKRGRGEEIIELR